MAKTNEIKNLETMLSESQIEEEINNILEELSANDAPEAVEDGEATEKSFDATEDDYFDDEEADDVKEVVVEAEELGKNDAPDAIKDGGSDEKAMTAKEDDVMNTEKADDAKEVVVESEDLELQEDLIEYCAAMSSLTEDVYNTITKSYNSTDIALHNMACDLVESIMAEAEFYNYLENPALLDESVEALNEDLYDDLYDAYKHWKVKKIYRRLSDNNDKELNDNLEQNKEDKVKSSVTAAKIGSNKYASEKEDWAKRIAQMNRHYQKVLNNNDVNNREKYKDDIKAQKEANIEFRAKNNADIKRLKSEAKNVSNIVDYNEKMNEINKLKEQNNEYKNKYAKKQVQDRYAKNVTDASKRFADQKQKIRDEVINNKHFQKGLELTKNLNAKVEEKYKQKNKEAKQKHLDNIKKNEKYLKDNGVEITNESTLFDRISYALCEKYEMTDDLFYTLYEDYEDAVNEDFVDDNPETSDAEDAGYGDGEAPEVTDAYIDPTLNDNDDNVESIDDAAEVDDVVSESFKTIFNILNNINEELAKNDAPDAVENGNPDEKSFSATKDDYFDGEEADDVDEVMIESLFNNCNGDIHGFCENVLMLYGIENPSSDIINELMEVYNEYNTESLNEATNGKNKNTNGKNEKPSRLKNLFKKMRTALASALAGAAIGSSAMPIRANNAGTAASKNAQEVLQNKEDYQAIKSAKGNADKEADEFTLKYNAANDFYNQTKPKSGKSDESIAKMEEKVRAEVDKSRATGKTDSDSSTASSTTGKTKGSNDSILKGAYRDVYEASLDKESADNAAKEATDALDAKDKEIESTANEAKRSAKEKAYSAGNWVKTLGGHAVATGALVTSLSNAIKRKKDEKNESYNSIEDVIKLGYNYLAEDANRYKLIEQVALSIANENSDRLFKELVESTALANRLETAIVAKYVNTAAARVANLMEDMKAAQSDEDCDDEYKLGHIGIDIETGEEDDCCKEKCNEELETNDAPNAVENDSPVEKSFNATKGDYFPNQTDSDDVKEVVVESEELGKNDAPEAVSDAAPVEKAFSATKDDYFDGEEADDVDDFFIIESATDDDIRAFLESSDYEASNANVSTIRRAINENVIGDIYDGVIQEGLVNYLRRKRSKKKAEKINIEIKKLDLLKAKESDPVKLDKINAKIEALKSKLNLAIAKAGMLFTESEELGKNDAPEAVEDSVTTEKSFNATKGDYFPNQTDSDDVKEVVVESEEYSKNDAPEAVSDAAPVEKAFSATEDDYLSNKTDSDDVKEVVVEACKTKRVAKTPSEQNKRGI